jgi:MYXO-CTERM domain-containing protein
MRRASTITLLSLALLTAGLLTARSAQACSCMPPPPPVEAAREADAVFHAKLVSVEDMPKTGQYAIVYKRFTFEVMRTFKGQLDAQVRVQTADNEAACGRSYGDPGSEWLIYARIDDQGQTHDSLCSRSKPLADAAADIAELEANAGTLDQPNEPPVEPGPAESEPAPVLPEEPEESEGPAPAKPGKKGCSVSDTETAPLELGLGLLGMLGMSRARRRR